MVSSWPGFLKDTLYAGGTAAKKAMKYAIEVKHRAGLPLRTYLWEDSVTNIVSGVSTTRIFCFAYGERQWFGLDGGVRATWQTVRDNAAAGTGEIACPQ